ncbi:hypothetical protein [Streptomyces radicis]|uniref:Uncharacterized protein n=1 Tax=Streptomyces radicis TaxID=1750517 RepID=A0A3A9VVQ3_9ACTN|nr:hypothetical protein [Streptomyces radicis]RKN04840.1 hypothetical protein D7319_26935 [Streptomyces radicis]RKN25350.1 hypothetical protein D7318_09095 [Streptomyces radicis]
MTARRRLEFAEPGEAGGLAAFLGRQLRWDRAAAARLQADDGVVAVFTRPARFDVLAVWPSRLSAPATLDVTVSAGALLEAIDDEGGAFTVPEPVTGPSWAGLLPPRGGWRPLAELPHATVREAAAAVVAEFRRRTERLPEAERTRAALDALAEEIWSRRLPGTPLPLRAVHAAHALGFLRADAPVGLLTGGPWLRLRTPLGATVVRREGGTPGLGVTPLTGRRA